MHLNRHVGLHRQSNCMYILTMPCGDHISVWNRFYFCDRLLIRTNQLAMGPKNASSLFSLSLTVEASETHVARVTLRLTIIRVAYLITVKAKRQKNSIYVIKFIRAVKLIEN